MPKSPEASVFQHRPHANTRESDVKSTEHGTAYAPPIIHEWNLNQEERRAVATELNALSETYVKRDNTPESDRRFLTDDTRTGWLDPQTREQLQELLGCTHLNQHALAQMTSLLEASKNMAMMHARDTVNDWDRHTSDKNLLIRLMEHAYNRAGTRALMHCTTYWPPPSPQTGDDDTDRSAVSAAETVLDTVLADRENGSWRRQAMSLQLVTLELEHYHATGEAPTWFRPEEMTVSAEMADAGYSIINPDPPPPEDAQAMADYITNRMNLFLPPTDGTPAPTSLEHNVTATAFGDSFVSPYASWELAGYGGPHNRQLTYHKKLPEERRTVEGDITDPLNHARTSYRVALQPCMTNRDIQIDIANRKPDSLAELVFTTSALLPNMENHCLDSAAHMPADSDAVRRTMTSYNPPIRWNSDAEISLRELNALTDDFTTVAPLQHRLNKMIEYLVNTHLMDSIKKHAQHMIEHYNMAPADAAHERASAYRWATKTTSGIQRMKSYGPAGENEPQTLLIVEAMEAIFHVNDELGRLHSALSGEDLIPLEDYEKPLYRQETRNLALNRLAHIDYCLVAAARTLPPSRPSARKQNRT